MKKTKILGLTQKTKDEFEIKCPNCHAIIEFKLPLEELYKRGKKHEQRGEKTTGRPD